MSPFRGLQRARSLLSSVRGRRQPLMTLPSFSLEGKTCVVTGAARGLGKEALTALALSGAQGACVDLSHAAGQSSIQDIQERVQAAGSVDGPADLRAYACDVTDEAQVGRTFDAIAKDFGPFDVVVTAAGITGSSSAERYAYEDWKQVIDVNLHGSFLCARAAGAHWIESQRPGNLVFVSSAAARKIPQPQKQAAYNTSKAAVCHLSKSLATEWAEYGIRVNALCPGYLRTDMLRDLQASNPALAAYWDSLIPMERMAEPAELQGTIVWMASDASSYMTGADIVGGEIGV